MDSVDLVLRSGNVEPLRTGATQGTKPKTKQQKGTKPDKVTFQLETTTIITNPKPVRVVQVTETQDEAMLIISQSVGQPWDNLDAVQQLTVPNDMLTIKPSFSPVDSVAITREEDQESDSIKLPTFRNRTAAYQI